MSLNSIKANEHKKALEMVFTRNLLVEGGKGDTVG